MRPARAIAFFVALSCAGLAGRVSAGEADVIDVKVRRSAPGVYDFDVTLRSVDKGWEYFADA